MIGKHLPLQDHYFKATSLRAPRNPQTSFAAEQAVDELAYMSKMDPVAFRLQNVANTTDDPSQRWRNVLTNAAKDANWTPKVAASSLSKADVVTGRGIAFGFYSNTMTCCVADITVTKSTGKIVAKTLHIAGDPGLLVYPAGSENNEEGAAMQGLSRAIYEQVNFDKRGVTSTRLGELPDGALQGGAEGVRPRALPHGRARPVGPGLAHDRLGRAGAVAGPGRRRERVLRRDRRAAPRVADDARRASGVR